MELNKRLYQIAEVIKTTRYVRAMKHSVVPKSVLISPEDGAAPGESVLSTLRELTADAYSGYRLYLAVGRGEKKRLCRMSGIRSDRIRFVKYDSPEHYRLLATAQYLITDSAFPGQFVKRPGQFTIHAPRMYTQERMGREEPGMACSMGNIQRSLLSADYLLLPDARTEERIKEAYDLSALFEGTYLCGEDYRGMYRYIFLGEEQMHIRAEKGVKDGKQKIMIYAGSLKRNGMTTALLNLLEYLDLQEYHYYAVFHEEYLEDDPSRLALLPDDIGLLAIPRGWYMTVTEAFAYKCGLNRPLFRKKQKEFYRRAYRRAFGDTAFDWCVHFTGYSRKMTGLFQEAPCKRMIFVHNDMLLEVKNKGNHHLPTLLDAYRNYECIAAVSPDILEQTAKLTRDRSRLHVVSNCHDYRRVIARAGEEIVFDDSTRCTVSLEELKRRLAQPNIRRMINIGRYSREKGHDLLLDAFAEYVKERPDSLLIIIGGEGDLYDETWERVKQLGLADCVILLKSVANPMPILKECDLFVLSSRYEGLGLVILEADTLGVPVVSTDVVGPHGFMKEHGGCLVAADPEGILSGMRAFDRGEVPVMGVDYEAYNRKAVSEFLQLISEAEDSADIHAETRKSKGLSSG